MGSIKHGVRLAAALALTFFVACGGESGGNGITDPPDTEKPPVVDTAAARIAATNQLLQQMEDAMNAANASAAVGGLPTPGAALADESLTGSVIVNSGLTAVLAATQPPPPDAAKCTYDEPNVRWNCPDFVQQNGVVIKTWFQFLDVDGNPMKDADTATTVAIRRFTGRSGVVTSQLTNAQGVTFPSQNTMNNTDTLTLSGLKGPPADRRLNGKGSMDVQIVPTGWFAGTMKATTTTEDLSFTPPPTPQSAPTVRYPISGKVTAIVQSVREDMPQNGSTTTQVTTYDGTKVAKLTITTASGQVIRQCTFDMTAPQGPPNCTVPGA